tara:strand:+ start:341 stop:463 length:123 start_codon:yes stop_codon:yes gene_type:complete
MSPYPTVDMVTIVHHSAYSMKRLREEEVERRGEGERRWGR